MELIGATPLFKVGRVLASRPVRKPYLKCPRKCSVGIHLERSNDLLSSGPAARHIPLFFNYRQVHAVILLKPICASNLFLGRKCV
jgi:hypothetical protein